MAVTEHAAVLRNRVAQFASLLAQVKAISASGMLNE